MALTAALTATALLLATDVHSHNMNCGPPGSPGAKAGSAISEAAQRAQQKRAEVFNTTAKGTSEKVSRATDCLKQVTDTVNQQIPSFGGGLLGSVAGMLTQNLANQACSVVSRAQGQMQQGVGGLNNTAQGAINSLPIGGTPTFNAGAGGGWGGASTGGEGGATPPSTPANEGAGAIQSIGSLLSRLF